jgi:trigger factor
MATVRTSVTELPESRVRVRAEVAAEEVERRVQQAARKLGRDLRVPGFRKGKVPPPVVIRRLGRELVLDEALRGSLGAWYADAIDEAGIVPVGEPELDLPEQLPGEGQPLSFSIEIGVRPRANLGAYRGLEVPRREPHVEERQIDEQIDALRDRLAAVETVQRPAQEGDFVVIDYEGTIDGEPFEGGRARDQMVELGSGRLIEGFERRLTGAREGQDLQFDVEFPADAPEPVAGRTARFSVHVHEVRAKRLPEADDSFASDASEFDTLASLREDIERQLRERDERAIEREFELAVLDAAVDNAQVEVPAKLIHARAHEMVHETMDALARQGIKPETYLRITGRSEEDLVKEAEGDAERALRREAVLAAIVEAEGIHPSDEELEVELLEPAAASEGKTTARELAQQLRASGRLERMRMELATRRALKLLVEQAKPISVAQAKAREQLWTPSQQGGSGAAGSSPLWTPGS